MTRVLTAICLSLIFLIQPIIAGKPSRSAQQSFVVRVAPKVKVQSSEIPRQPAATIADVLSPSNSDTSDKTFEAALNVEGGGPAGLFIQIEVRARSTPKDNLKALTGMRLNLRIAEDVKNSWTDDVDNRASSTKPMALQANSKGTGPATLIISGEGEPDEVLIITTVISQH